MLNLKNRLYVATFQENSINVAKQFGLGLEFNHTCISEALDHEAQEALITCMNRDFELSGAEKAILHGPFTEIYPAAIDYRARDMATLRLSEAFSVCRQLEVSRMVVHTGWLPFIYFKEWQSQKSSEFWEAFMKDKPADFTLYIENVLEDEPYMLSGMMKRISNPNIKLCLDIGHANAMSDKNISMEMWIKELAPYIGHFHLHNNYGEEDSHGDFDHGSMDMEEVLYSIESNCSDAVTFTIEARDCGSCAHWLKARGYI